MDKFDKLSKYIIFGAILNVIICLVLSILTKSFANSIPGKSTATPLPTKTFALPPIWTSTPSNNPQNPDISAEMLVWKSETSEDMAKFAIAQPLFNDAIKLVPDNKELLLSSEFKDNIAFFLLEMVAASGNIKNVNCSDPELRSEIDLLNQELFNLDMNLNNSIATLDPFAISETVRISTNIIEIFDRIQRHAAKYN
jgi:hypothetical protein